MSRLPSITSGLRSLFRREQVDRDLEEELRGYQETAAEEKIKDGMSRAEAFRAVRLKRGNLEGTKEIDRSDGWEFFVETCGRFQIVPSCARAQSSFSRLTPNRRLSVPHRLFGTRLYRFGWKD